MKTLIIAALIACSAALAADDQFGSISQADLAAAIKDKKAVVIDVNGSDSWIAGHIPSAIDFDAKQAALASVLPADKGALIVAYCGSPQCPAWKQAATAVAKLGYTNVKHFTGGLSGWKEAKADLEKGKKEG